MNRKKTISAVLSSLLVCCALCSCGESAYDIAVKNGFEGSEQEWLESLKGEKGDSVTVESLYETAKNNGFEGDIHDFIKEYLSGDYIENKNYGGNFPSETLLSVVSITCSYQLSVPTLSTWGTINFETRTETANGSGIIYKLDKDSGDAYVVTNYHVVYSTNAYCPDEKRICSAPTVNLYGKNYQAYAMKAEFIGGSSDNDVAVLKITANDVLKSSNAKEILPSEKEVCVGDEVFAVGNAYGFGITATKGMVSVDSETVKISSPINDSEIVEIREIRTDAAVNSGNSGGGLFDADGRAVGLVNAKSNKSGVDGIGYAIPLSLFSAVADGIIENYEATGEVKSGIRRGLLGVMVYVGYSDSVIDPDTGKVGITEKIVVSSTAEGGLVHGKLVQYDVLYKITMGEREFLLDRNYKLTDALYRARNGMQMKLVVNRNGYLLTYEFTFSDENFIDVA